MNVIQGIVSVTGRLLLVALFLMAAANKIANYPSFVAIMESEGLPQPGLLLAGAIAFLIGGGLMVLTGFQGRFGALLLAIFLGMATYYFHDFWTFDQAKLEANRQQYSWMEKLSDEEKQTVVKNVQQQEMTSFFKNLSMLGAMVFILGNGTGAGSIEGGHSSEKKPVRQGDF